MPCPFSSECKDIITIYTITANVSSKECSSMHDGQMRERCFSKVILFLFQIPPLPMNYRPTVAPAICAPSVSAFCMDDEQLNVLKVIEKKPNSNLIDLNSFDQMEDRTNVRVSVLEAFDPLLIKTDGRNDSIQDHKDGKLSHTMVF